MQFETKAVPGSPDHVKDFLDDLIDRTNPEDTTAAKIIEKLESWAPFSLEELLRVRHIKHIEGDVYSTRVKIRSNCYRFLGYPIKQTMYFVHSIIKKTDKLPRKDIALAQTRIDIIKEI
jgi:phage-related protein